MAQVARRRKATNEFESFAPDLARRDDPPASARFGDEKEVTLKENKRLLAEEKRWASNVTISNIFWIVACMAVVHRFDVVDAVLYDPRVHREYLKYAAALFGIAVWLCVFCAIVLEKMLGIKYDKDYRFSWAVPVATLSGIGAFLLFWMAIWGVWKWMTFIIVPCLFMGLLMMIVFSPV